MSKDASARTKGPDTAWAPVKPAMVICSCCSPNVVDNARATKIVLVAETDGVDWLIFFVKITITFNVPFEVMGTVETF